MTSPSVAADASRRANRTKTVDVVPEADGRFRFSARLTDRAFGGDYGGAENVTVHDFHAEGVLEGPSLIVTELRVTAIEHPYAQCPFVTPASTNLVGLPLMGGWRRAVLGTLAGTRGCTHVNTLLLGLSEITTMVFFLRMNQDVAYTPESRRDGSWINVGLGIAPSLTDACYSLASEGPVLGQRAPGHPSTQPLTES